VRHLLILFALLALPAAARSQEAGQAPGAVRLSQIRDATDEQLVGLFFGPVRTFPFVGYRNRDAQAVAPAAPVAQLRTSLAFYSAMRATDYPGVCTSDWLTVTLRRTIGSTREDPAYEPSGFQLRPIFFVENREEAVSGFNVTRREPYDRTRACAAIDPRRDGTPADSAYQFTKARALVESLGSEARAGRTLAPLDCSRMAGQGTPPAGEAACLDALRGLGENQAYWVQRCLTYREAPGGCIHVQTGSWFIEFDLNSNQTPRRIVVEGIEDHSAVM
jgi:hypothetical protein